MTENIIIELVKIVPSIFTFILILVIYFSLRRPIIDKLLPSIYKFEGFGLKITMLEEKLKEVSKNKNVNDGVEYDVQVLRRAEHIKKELDGKKILWVDDNISYIVNETELFKGLGLDIDIATTTEEAIEKLRHFSYDVIISDMDRYDKATAGLELLNEKVKIKNDTPLIFYIGILDKSKGVPPYAFGITDRPDELLHLTFDVIERSEF